MTTNQSVRFFVRANRGSTIPPLRAKIWIAAVGRWLYISTDLRISPVKFRRDMTTDGLVAHYVDKAFAMDVQRYKDAVNLVVSAAVVNGRIESLTSDYLNRRVNGIVARMRANANTDRPQPIVVGASPMDTAAMRVCRGCRYFGETCTAPWTYEFERDTAAEFAAYNGICNKRVNSDGLRQPNPNLPAEPGTLEDESNENNK